MTTYLNLSQFDSGFLELSKCYVAVECDVYTRAKYLPYQLS